MRNNMSFCIGIYLYKFLPVVKELIFQFKFGSKKAYGSNNYLEMQEAIMLSCMTLWKVSELKK